MTQMSYGLQQTFQHRSIDRIETDCTKEKIQESGNGYMLDNRHSAARTVFNVGDRTPAMEDNVYVRSEEHTSELQSLMRISYAVFCLKKKKHHNTTVQLRTN